MLCIESRLRVLDDRGLDDRPFRRWQPIEHGGQFPDRCFETRIAIPSSGPQLLGMQLADRC